MRKALRSLRSSLIEEIRTQDAPCALYYHRIDKDNHRSRIYPKHFFLQREYLIFEVLVSHVLLQKKLGHAVSFFCYPRSAPTPAVKAIVRQSRYSEGCNAFPGLARLESNRSALPRIYISHNDTLQDFRKKFCGAYDWLHAGVQLWRQVRA